MKKGLLLLLSVSLLLTSCGMYRRNFDCPPSPGVPCTSVTDIEQMVVETPSGPDIFGIDRGMNPGQCYSRRIWMATNCGRGYYIPLDLEDPCCKH